jgi:hypothetical protein
MPNVALIEPKAEAEPVERRFFSKAETRLLNVVFEACAEVPAVAFPVRQLMLLSSTSRRTVQTTLAKAHAAGVIVRQKRPRAALGKRDQRALMTVIEFPKREPEIHKG